jgi:hypothetical protein
MRRGFREVWCMAVFVMLLVGLENTQWMKVLALQEGRRSGFRGNVTARARFIFILSTYMAVITRPEVVLYILGSEVGTS